MSDSKGRKKSQKTRTSTVKQGRNQKIINEAVNGKKNTTELGEEFGLSRRQVSRIINSDQADQFIKDIKQAYVSFLDKALEVQQTAMDKANEDLTNALKASRDCLKSHGIITDSSNISVSMPEPTVIERMDGGKLELSAGNKRETKEEKQ